MEKNQKNNSQDFDFSVVEDKIQQVQNIIEKAVKSKDFQEMSQSVTQMVNKTLDQYKKEHPEMGKTREKPQADQRSDRESGSTVKGGKLQTLYMKPTGEKVRSILLAVFGGILTGSTACGFLAVQIVRLLTDFGNSGAAAVMLAGMAAGAFMLGTGIFGLGKLRRFKKYQKTLGKRTYCDLTKLAQAVGKPVKFVKKDLKKMIGKGWFTEGCFDGSETCLITSRETFCQYQEMEKALEEKKKQEALRAREESELSPEVKEVLEKGRNYLDRLRKSNDAIPGEEISAKIFKMEKIVDQIFQRAKAHPEIIPDLKRMMDYYLPMTVKLLEAYEDMDSQPVQGETIRSSKKEIEDTLDTLNDAFAKLLDSVFQDTAWDVSSDISVLHTLLAQEGLKDSDFKIQH